MTTYFGGFPTTTFDNKLVTNILIRLDFLNKIKETAVLYEQYIIPEGQTAEELADAIYEDSNLFWIILWTNDIIDYFHDWPMTSDRLLEFVEEKYGSDNIYAAHHYETTSQSDLGAGVWVNLGEPFSNEVDNYTYESTLNEARRKINILKPVYVSQVLAEYRKELSNINADI